MEELLRQLVEAPTTLGNEEPGQAVLRDAFRAVGLEPRDIPLDPAAREGDWIYGRGAGDMKAGLVAIIGAVRATQPRPCATRSGAAAVGRRGGVHGQRHAPMRPLGHHRCLPP